MSNTANNAANNANNGNNGLSAERMTALKALAARYAAQGYDFLSMTDHNVLVSHRELPGLLTLTGLDWVTSLTGAATAVCNVGPGLGNIIGPVGNFSTLPDSAKWLLTVGMLLGRLEILTVLVPFTRTFWKH